MAIDLDQFHQVFFEESLEGLDIIERALLAISVGEQPGQEVINTIFRAAHSIKGGSGTFGFTAIAEFTHVMETLLDEARAGKRVLSAEAVDLLLRACDCLRGMVEALKSGGSCDTTAAAPLVQAFQVMLQQNGDTSQEKPVQAARSLMDPLEQSVQTLLNGHSVAATATATVESTCSRRWRIHFAPEPQILLSGNEPLRLFRELASLGELKVEADASHLPPLDQLVPDECYLHWTLWLTTEAGRDAILEVFEWVVDECSLSVEPDDTAAHEVATAPVQPTSLPEAGGVQRMTIAAAVASSDSDAAAQGALPSAVNADVPAAAVASTSIRVGIDKVDSLINLVGELVITQSMLSELGSHFSVDKLDRLAAGLEQLQQNTRELQESVMRIRMLPISFAFNRFPRMIRDLSLKTGKNVELKMSGEQTELDKTVMEQLSDPLVHLVRNAIDHGIETPDERRAQGKSDTGTILLNAYHKGGSIVVEIRDDGRGIDARKVLAKAREKGLVAPDQELSTAEIHELIFEPGFSTAAVVSDISGRGVGMDVVRRNIKLLGGRIEIESQPGKGSLFRVQLPLTLAILDGQLVTVGEETYIIPLTAIVESLQIKPELVNRVAGDMVLYRLREDNVPIIPIYREFNIPAQTTTLDKALLVVVEADGRKVGLLVDDLLAQQQVVIKSLESNYRRIEGVSGATILGDGSVALILDIPGLIDRASRRARQARAA